ncbi:DUF3943 domain-containing protein [Pseudomonadota bacterium]
MIKNRLLGLLLALAPMTGMCADIGLTIYTQPIVLPAYEPALHLAAADNTTVVAPQLDITKRKEIPPSDEYKYLDIPSQPDWDGLRHDSQLFVAYQTAVVGVLFLMPESVSKWGEGQKKGNVFRKWNDNVNNLRKDKDEWEINYIGHPYFGASYYVRARQRGYDRQSSFWYSAVMSTIYEYGVEAIFEPVSIQDLIFTPVGGAIVGEYFMSARNNIRRRISETGITTTSDKVKLFFTDPFGSVNRKVDKWFGINESQEARLDVVPMFERKLEQNNTPKMIGLQALYTW